MKNPDIQVRRKPRQSRAKLTQEALQESFVRLLHERAAHNITIREITDLAGVGLDYKELPRDVKAGDVLLLNDGLIVLTVEFVRGEASQRDLPHD